MSVELIHGDCIEVMRQMPDSSVDAIEKGAEYLPLIQQRIDRNKSAEPERPPVMNLVEQIPMFDVDTPPVKPGPTRKASDRPKWAQYRPKNSVKCDDCLSVLAEASGVGPATRAARWRRKVGTADLLLCYAHANQRRIDDGMPELDEYAS